MIRYRIGLLAFTLTSVAALGAANAADVYQAPSGGYKDGPAYVTVNWAGFYAGVNSGYGWSEHNNQLAVGRDQFPGLSPEGGFGGGQIGYNWQGIWHPRLVLGIEADIQASGIKDSKSVIGGRGELDTFTSELNWFGTVRGRIGYALDRTLLYATGGFAYGGVKNAVSNKFIDLIFDDTATGYVVGGGLEYKISPAWSVKAEYQYINLGKNDPVGPGGIHFSSASDATLVDDAFHTARLGVNYHFGSGYEPLK